MYQSVVFLTDFDLCLFCECLSFTYVTCLLLSLPVFIANRVNCFKLCFWGLSLSPSGTLPLQAEQTRYVETLCVFQSPSQTTIRQRKKKKNPSILLCLNPPILSFCLSCMAFCFCLSFYVNVLWDSHIYFWTCPIWWVLLCFSSLKK